MTNIKVIYDKYRNGDPISDEELKDGIKHFTTLERYLHELGPYYHLTWRDTWAVLMALQGFKEARSKRNKI